MYPNLLLLLVNILILVLLINANNSTKINSVIDISNYIIKDSRGSFERKFESKDSLCDHIEFYYWKEVENNCRNISIQRISDYKSYIKDFQYFQNIRLLPGYSRRRNTTSLLIAFDIVSNISSTILKKGNWWSVYAKLSKEYEENRKKVINVVGRVIDHWNGNYSIYLQLPYSGLYEVDIVLDYHACRGYPTGIKPPNIQGGNTQYIGMLAYREKLRAIPNLFKRSLTTKRREYKRGLQHQINSLLADVGFFENRIWHPPVASCLPPLALPHNHSNVMFLGDSTNGQIYRCLNLILEGCSASAKRNCQDVEYLLKTCKDAFVGNSSFVQPKNLVAWKRMIESMSEFQGLMGDDLPVDALTRLLARDESSKNDVIIILNAGLHPLARLNWNQLKNYFDVFVKTIKSSRSVNKKWLIWREIWSVHEYSYMPNSYRNRTGSEPWYKPGVIIGVTDPGAYLQRSYTLFRFFKEGSDIIYIMLSITNKTIKQGNYTFQYLPAYWMSKSHIKVDDEVFAHDMVHHEIYVILEIINHLLKSVTL